MARKVFVSYKYGDTQVASIDDGSSASLARTMFNIPTTARHYVDKIMSTIEGTEIFKGEEDDNDLSRFKDDTIRTKLKEKIRDSSITIVLVSKGMKDTLLREADQWIPWEVSYSLRDLDGNATNGMLAVILPEENNSYDHYFSYSDCAHCNTRTHHHDRLFKILSSNMFNRIQPNTQSCLSPVHDSNFHIGTDHSYIHQVEWHKFISNPSKYLDIAENIRANLANYKIRKLIAE